MHKLLRVHVLFILMLSLALLISVAGCGGDENKTTNTPKSTPTVTATAKITSTPTTLPTITATPKITSTPKTPTSTASPTSSSAKTLSDIYGGGKSLGDVKFDMVTTSPQLPQAQTATTYWKNFGDSNDVKFRYDTSTPGGTSIYLVDYSAKTAYMWMKEANMAYKMDMSQAPQNPTENSDQIHPTYIGTDTVDGHLCEVWQWTTQVTGAGTSTEKVWVWKDKSFPVKMEMTVSNSTTTMEYKNIVFGPLSDDLFKLPSTVQIVQMPTQ